MNAAPIVAVLRWIKASILGLLPDLRWASELTPTTLRADAMAALTGATIVLPQGVAFAAIAGLPPEYGFYTAMITPVIAAIFGSSWHLVSGPTTAISALVFGALAGSFEPGSGAFIQAAITLSLLVGIFQLILALARFGVLVDFVSHSVMVGFTAGAAILIALSQVKHALGIELPRPEHFFEFAQGLWTNALLANWRSIAIAFVALGVGVLVKRFWPKLPNYLIALFAASLLSIVLDAQVNGVNVVGVIPSIAPSFGVPALSLDVLRDLAPSALAVALVGLLEAVSIARAIAVKSNQELDANREFAGQGLSNIVGSFFKCYAGSGSFTRSGVNYESGARTPMAAVFAAIFLFIILLFVAPLFAFVPIPAMAGVIMLVAWKLIDFKEIRHIIATSHSETAIAGATFGATLFVDLEFAIYVGVLLSFLLFLNRTARPFIGIGAPDPSSPARVFRHAALHGLQECPQMVMSRLDGPLYFGSVEHVRRQFRTIERERSSQKHMLFIVKGVGEIDLPGAELMIEEARRRKRRGGSFHVQTKTPGTIQKLNRFHVANALSAQHIHQSKSEAIAEIVPGLDQDICATCLVRIFKECPKVLADDTDAAGQATKSSPT